MPCQPHQASHISDQIEDVDITVPVKNT
uniref:Uncharacterized protein n=1 Tax=Arundo donax TaxID=35708 RepID=A0A0A9BRK0_ARUDO